MSDGLNTQQFNDLTRGQQTQSSRGLRDGGQSGNGLSNNQQPPQTTKGTTTENTTARQEASERQEEANEGRRGDEREVETNTSDRREGETTGRGVGREGGDRNEGRGDAETGPTDPDEEIRLAEARTKVELDLQHNKWLEVMKNVYKKGYEGRYMILQSEYGKWCSASNTTKRQLNLFELEDKPVIEIAIGTQLPHCMPPLPDYLKEAMTNNDRYFPFTIFNTITWWPNPNDSVHSKVPNEFRQDFAGWARSFDMAVEYYRTVFRREDIASRLEVHKSNVLEIQSNNHGRWMPAMRYDLYHRQNIWNYRLENGSMADVGMLNQTLVERAKRDSEGFKELFYTDNPYVLNGAREHFSPYDGSDRTGRISWDAAESVESESW